MRIAWLLGMVMACTPAASTPVPVPPTVPMTEPSAVPLASESTATSLPCPERVEVLRERLAMAVERPAEGGLRAAKPPRFDEVVGEPMFAAPELRVTAHGVTVDGMRADDFVDILRRKRELHTAFHPNQPPPEWRVVLVADATLASARIEEVLVELRAAKWMPWLLVRVPDYPHIPRNTPPWVARLVDHVETSADTPSDKARHVATMMRRAVGSCDAMADAMAPVAEPGVDPTHKPRLMAEAIIAGAEGCDCQADIDGIEALFIWMLTGNDIRYRLLPIPTTRVRDGDVQQLADRIVSR